MSIYPASQDTPWQQSNTIDLGKTAVLVIDILGGNSEIAPVLKEMADNAVSIVKSARRQGIPIFFCNDTHIPGIDRELELWGEHGLMGTEGCKPLDAFEVREGDFIIPKRRYNSFFQTDLDITLRELGVDTLIAVGCDTNICVMQTLAGAYFLGYKTVVAADACASFLIGNHEEGLEYFTRCYDSRVVSTETVLDYFEAGK